MNDYRSKRTTARRRARRVLGLGGFAAASAVLAGCGAEGDVPTSGEAISQSEQAIVDCSTIQANSTAIDVKKVLTLAKSVADAIAEPKSGNPIQVAIDLLDFWGGPSVDQQIAALNERLFCLAQAGDWKMVALDYNTNQFAPVSAAWMEAQGPGFSRGSFYDGSSHNATVASGGLVMFERVYNPNDPTTNGPWKSVITNNKPEIIDVNQVFDWRMALPGFTRLLVARMAMIAMMDPNFENNGQWNAELGDGTPSFPGYRGVLKARLDQMVRGVRCDFKDRTRVTGDPISRTWRVVYDKTEVACADVNTGLYAMRSFTRSDGNNCSAAGFAASCMTGLASQAIINSDLDWFRRRILNQMPVFEMQSLIDTLYLYTHPAPDLAEERGRIPLSANRALCLDVPGANSANGTALQIFGCNATAAQQFAYDRVSKTIRNPAIGKCVQVRPTPFGSLLLDNPSPGAIAEISDCTNPPVARQQWTYSHETGTLRNAIGTVLDVQWGNLSSGIPVWLWDYNGGGAQLWHADRNPSICSGLCMPQCSAGCAGAGAGTGACIGSCMASCVQGCMNAWP